MNDAGDNNDMTLAIVSTSDRPDLAPTTGTWRWEAFYKDAGTELSEVLEGEAVAASSPDLLPTVLVLLEDDLPVGMVAMRKVPRDLNEDARDVARAIAATPAYELSRHRRKKVEMLFVHLKRILRMARLRLRGPCGALDEFLLAATAQNLRRLAKLRPQTTPYGVIAT